MRWNREINELTESKVTAEKHGSQLCNLLQCLIPAGQQKRNVDIFKMLLC